MLWHVRCVIARETLRAYSEDWLISAKGMDGGMFGWMKYLKRWHLVKGPDKKYSQAIDNKARTEWKREKQRETLGGKGWEAYRQVEKGGLVKRTHRDRDGKESSSSERFQSLPHSWASFYAK